MSQIFTNEALHKKTPQELTALLYEACITNLEKSINSIENKEFLDANIYLQKSIDIVHRLGAGINYEAGIVADQLDALYNYMANKIFEANYEKNIEKVNEVIQIITELMTAWHEAMKKNVDIQPRVLKQQTNAYEQTVVYEK